ncbi:MAG: hypothetical protein U0T56_00665 [Ferruginibacter sp.]
MTDSVTTIPLLTSSRQDALQYLDSIGLIPASKHWPNIDPFQFILNLKLNVEKPESIYPGRETNFCGYGAITYLVLQDDPLGYARTLVRLYTDGQADYGSARFRPSKEIKPAAGKLRFKGVLDIRPAEQLWFLVLADHFKGYLNFFNRRYDPGDENSMWAAVNYAKFNRMARKLLHYQVKAYGSDLFRPSMHHTDEFISKLTYDGVVVLYLNNRILHKKKLDKIKLAIPTHYVVLQNIHKDGNTLTMQYWDYGSKTQRQMTPSFFRKLVFGISYCTKKATRE